MKIKKVVTKLMRWVKNKSLNWGGGGRALSGMAKLAQRSLKTCLPQAAFGDAGDS